MRSIPSKESVEQQPLFGVLDVIPVHQPLSKPGCLRVLLCSTDLYKTIPEEAMQPIKDVAHALVQVQVPRDSPMKKEEIFLESKWVWPQNSLASGPPPPEMPSAEESQMILRCMRQTWAVAVAAHKAGVNASLSACLIHDPFLDRVLAADISAARGRIPRTSTAGVLLAADSVFPSHNRGMTFAATLATPPSLMDKGSLASAGADQLRVGGPPSAPIRSTSLATQVGDESPHHVASADLPALAGSCLRSLNITQQLPSLCRQLGLEAAGDEECQQYMDAVPSTVGGAKRPPPIDAPPPDRITRGQTITPIPTPHGPKHILDGISEGGVSLDGTPPPALASSTKLRRLANGSAAAADGLDGPSAPLPQLTHPNIQLAAERGDVFARGIMLPISPLHTAVMRCVGQVAAQDKIRHEKGHVPYRHRVAFLNSTAVVPGDVAPDSEDESEDDGEEEGSSEGMQGGSPPADDSPVSGGGTTPANPAAAGAGDSTGTASLPADSPGANSQGDSTGEDGVPNRYLCTGFDVYCTFEPEPMDAMALVHSRVRRVIYCLPNLAEGALGSRLMLHEQRQLNHHYRVFRVLEAPEGIVSMGAPPPPAAHS